jgi:hypothetical protein
MDWNDDELGDHLDDADGSYYEQAGDLAEITDQDIAQGKDVGITFGVSEPAFADLEPEAADEALEIDPNAIGDGEGTSGDEGGAWDEQWEKEREPDIENLEGSIVLSDALASQLEGSLNTSEWMSMIEEAREFYKVRLVEINGRMKPFGEPADVQEFLKAFQSSRRYMTADGRIEFSDWQNRREYLTNEKRSLVIKAAEQRDRDRFNRLISKGKKRIKKNRTVEERVEDGVKRKVREVRRTSEEFRSLTTIEAKERYIDQLTVEHGAKLRAKYERAAEKATKEARKVTKAERSHALKIIAAETGKSELTARRKLDDLITRLTEINTILSEPPNALHTKSDRKKLQDEAEMINARLRDFRGS